MEIKLSHTLNVLHKTIHRAAMQYAELLIREIVAQSEAAERCDEDLQKLQQTAAVKASYKEWVAYMEKIELPNSTDMNSLRTDPNVKAID